MMEYSLYDSVTMSTIDDNHNGQVVEEKPAPPAKKNVNLLVTRARLRDMEIGYFLDFEENPNSTRAQVSFLSNFVSDGNGNYLDNEAAEKTIRQLNFTQLGQTIIEVTRMIKETAVPKE